MSDIGLNFAIDLTLIICVAIIGSRILYVMKDRQAFLRKHKYKVGSIEYQRVMQLTSPKFRTILAVAAPLTVLKTILDVYLIVHEQGRSGITQIGAIVGFVIFIALVVAIGIFVIFNDEMKR